MSTRRTDLGERVVDACHALGFALAGVAPAVPTRRREEFLRWLRAGKHGDMAYLEEMLEERMDVTRLLPGARAVIIVGDLYATGRDAAVRSRDHEAQRPPRPTGVIARYARGRDYHAVIKTRLHALTDRLRDEYPDARFRAFTDTGPALEREHAAAAGMGVFIGKHTLAIHPTLGSWFLLGGVATTLELLEETAAPSPLETTDHCGTCTACIDACPTRAITPHEVDATRCVSYLTLERRGVIDPALHAGVGDRLAGCDVCQDVCPFNSGEHATPLTAAVNPAYREDHHVRTRLDIADVLTWTDEDRSGVLGPSAAKRASTPMLRRNALVIAGNTLAARRDGELLDRVQRIASDGAEDPLVRDTARQVLTRLATTPASVPPPP